MHYCLAHIAQFEYTEVVGKDFCESAKVRESTRPPLRLTGQAPRAKKKSSRPDFG